MIDNWSDQLIANAKQGRMTDAAAALMAFDRLQALKVQ